MPVLVLASCSAILSIGIRPQAVRSVESILTPAIIPFLILWQTAHICDRTPRWLIWDSGEEIGYGQLSNDSSGD